MGIKKEQERAELHKIIWNIADDLRGTVDGWDFKQYVLGMLFYRYISENITDYINENEHKSGDIDFSGRHIAGHRFYFDYTLWIHRTYRCN